MRRIGFPAIRYTEGPPASGRKPRSRLYVVLLVGVILLAAIGVAYYEYDVANPNCTSAPSSSSLVATVTDCKLGTSLTLAVKEAALRGGSNQTLYLSVKNAFNRANNVTYVGFPALPSFTFVNATVYLLVHPNGCQIPIPPAFILIYNATSGKLLQLNTYSPTLLTCVGNLPAYFHFTANQNLTGFFSIGGYYTSINLSEPWLNATYHTLPPGRYNAVAFDPWKHMAELNFTVVS